VAVTKGCNGNILIIDTVESREKCKIELFFHFHPECLLVQSGQIVKIVHNGIELHMLFNRHLALHLFKGSEDPLLGWFSREFNHLEKCWTLVAEGAVKGKTVITTTIELV
jgi:6-phosphogluconate dehydrogenase (decarboxylating)